MSILKDLTPKKYNEHFEEMMYNDLKVPAVAQLRGLELLENSFLPEPEQKILLQEIKESCNYMVNIITMIHSIHKIEHGIEHFIFERFDMQKLLYQCFEEMKKRADKKNVIFACFPYGASTEIYADVLQIKTVLTNLLDNALTYSEYNNKISVSILSNKKELSTSITSTGNSLSKEFTDNFFKRLFEDNPQYTTVGEGLRLFLCKKIVEMHSGKIFAEAAKKNLTITFTLPR